MMQRLLFFQRRHPRTLRGTPLCPIGPPRRARSFLLLVEVLICSNVEAAVVPGDKVHLHDTLGQCWSEDAATPAAGMGARGTAPRAPLGCDACTEIPHQVQARSLYCQAHRLRLPNSSSVLCVPQKNGNRNLGALVARLWTGNVPTNPQLAKIEMAPFDNTTVTDTNEVLLVARDPRSRLLSFYLHQIYPGSARASYCRHSPSCQDHARKIGFDPNEPPRFAQFVELVARRAKQRGGGTCFVEHHLCSQVSGCLFGVRVRSTTVLKLEEMPLWYADFAAHSGIGPAELDGDQWRPFTNQPCYYSPQSNGSCLAWDAWPRRQAPGKNHSGSVSISGGGVPWLVTAAQLSKHDPVHATGASMLVTQYYGNVSSVTSQLVAALYHDDYRLLGYS